MNAVRFRTIASGQDRSCTGAIARLGFSVLSPFYRLAVAVRNAMFDAGLRRPVKLPRRTISVGNLTTGGTGKTPMVIELARRLVARGERPAVLLRGYKSVDGQSDEATLLREALGSGVPVEANPSRVAGAAAVLARDESVTCILLDDGFQHRQVDRDVDIVLIDATEPFGYGRLLPRGLLREPIDSLRRADAVIVTRADQGDVADPRVRPMARVAYTWRHLLDAQGDEHPLTCLAGQNVLGICGVGNPLAFERSLKQHAADADVAAFDDHHHYTTDEITALVQERKPQAVVTTEKDWVKWRQLSLNVDVPVYRAVLGVDFLDGGEALDALLTP